jgi:hypothetical protein
MHNAHGPCGEKKGFSKVGKTASMRALRFQWKTQLKSLAALLEESRARMSRETESVFARHRERLEKELSGEYRFIGFRVGDCSSVNLIHRNMKGLH